VTAAIVQKYMRTIAAAKSILPSLAIQTKSGESESSDPPLTEK